MSRPTQIFRKENLMAKLSERAKTKKAKMIIVGDSGSGKTGALLSLVKAGYKLRVLDMDNGLSILEALIKKHCPDKLDAVDAITLRDAFKAGPQGLKANNPKAFVQSMKYLNKWDDESIPSEWGKEDDKIVFVLDTLTHLSNSAYAWADAMNPGAKDKRQTFRAAQEAVENTIAMITSDEFDAHVVVISHIKRDDLKADGTGGGKAYPSAVGRALGPIIGSYFDNLVMARATGTGDKIKRTIRLNSTAEIDLKSTAALKIEGNDLPLETGLADLFKQILEN
jgi:hypothetical protein